MIIKAFLKYPGIVLVQPVAIAEPFARTLAQTLSRLSFLILTEWKLGHHSDFNCLLC